MLMMNYISSSSAARFFLLLAVALFSQYSIAEAEKGHSSQMALRVSGELFDGPACDINSGHTIEIGFGVVGINKIASGFYRKEIPYNIECEAGDTTGYTLHLGIYSDIADFDREGATIKTSEDNLGVKIYKDNAPLALNTMNKIQLTNKPTLEAVLIANSAAKVDAGDFSATAVFKAVYQ